jgi:hypothetical protein
MIDLSPITKLSKARRVVVSQLFWLWVAVAAEAVALAHMANR